jgi:hypothetical protein
MAKEPKGTTMIDLKITIVSADTDDIDEDNSSVVYM